MATLTVAPGATASNAVFQTISAAIAAAHSGDTINVDAGTYTNDFPQTINKSLTLQSLGGTVKLVANTPPPNGKGIIDEGGSGVNVTIQGFDISGATDGDNNGAGIRYEGGTLTLNNDTIHNNQDGILSNIDPNGSITINNSTFTQNGAGDGQSHDIYIGDIANFTITNSTITAANVGHEIKSRAQNTTITNNVIQDGSSGNSSYEIDLPNGGNALVANNVVQKGTNAQNPVAITFGEEGNVYGNSNLVVRNNTIVNNDSYPYTIAVRNSTSTTATISNNYLFGWNTVSSGSAQLSGNTVSGGSQSLSSLNGSKSSTQSSTAAITPATTASPASTATFLASPSSAAAAPASSSTSAVTNAAAAASPSTVATPAQPSGGSLTTNNPTSSGGSLTGMMLGSSGQTVTSSLYPT